MQQLRVFKAILILVFLGFIWGSGYTLAKYAMTNGVPPLGYAFWQSLGPALILTIISALKGHSKLLKPSNWPYFFVCGLIGIAIPNTNMYFIASHLPAGVLAVLVNTVPILVYPLALLVGQEKIDIRRFFSILMGMIGIVLIIGFNSSGIYSIWSLLALISPMGFALCSIYIGANQPKEIDALCAASGMLLTASITLLPLVLQQNAFYPLTGTFTLAKQVIVLEIILSSLGYLLFFVLIRIAGPVFYSLTGGIVSITGLFWGYMFFNEIPSGTQCLAIGLVITAIFLLSWSQSKQVRGV